MNKEQVSQTDIPLIVKSVLTDAFGRTYAVGPGYLAEDDEALYTVAVYAMKACEDHAAEADFGQSGVEIELDFAINGERQQDTLRVLPPDGPMEPAEIYFLYSGGSTRKVLREALSTEIEDKAKSALAEL